MDEGLADGLERGLIDMRHIIVDGMPRRTETTLGTSGIIRDDIDGRNLGDGIHRNMVVSNLYTLLLGKE